MGTKAATGPVETVIESPCNVVIACFPSKVIGVPLNIKIIPIIIEIGTSTRVIDFVKEL
ncbi:hypothetical protein SDC9_194108 [bioreactor metagenome]|uniref:Uncharacterized protein n=1 Tax=bioreactor metagenome TaxID=1076179 RepID=A0A645I5E5_9ZZZZ